MVKVDITDGCLVVLEECSWVIIIFEVKGFEIEKKDKY